VRRCVCVCLCVSEQVCVQTYLCSMPSACAVIYCHLLPDHLFKISLHYLTNGRIFEKKIIENKLYIGFPAQHFVRNVFHFKKNSIKYYHKFT
jgi:hypothetical protein